MDIKIREYKDGEYNILLELAQKLAEYVKSIDPIGRIQNLAGYSETDLQDTLEDLNKNKGKILFAETDGKVIGYIIGIVWLEQPKKVKLEIGLHKTGEIMDFFVNEKFRGLGIGHLLLSKIEEYFKTENCDGIWLTVFEPNKNAHEFYKRNNFIDREIGMLKKI
jgi:ribosomal protein S18 acetylase RimI-like enzyme